MNGVIVAGIGTGIGKTFIAAVLVEALQADYWKPLQAGNLDFTDTDFVRQHTNSHVSIYHPEAYRLQSPMSPHAAAKLDGVTIKMENLQMPVTRNRLVIELAGGLMVPLNDELLNIDLIAYWKLPVLLVSQNYLGSINHTLLSIELLRQRNATLKGIIFNGKNNPATEEIILKYTGAPCIARVGEQETIGRPVIESLAVKLKPEIFKIFE